MAATSPIINVMTRAARKAAKGLVRDFGEVEHLQVSVKGPSDFVSSADLKAETVVGEELRRAHPTYGFLMEETGATLGEDLRHRWVVDPLDGTTNFLHGIPHFAVTIGLERDGEIVAGVTYDPLRDELFWAEKGAGAYVNDRRLRVSARRIFTESVIATGIPFRERGDHAAYLDMLGRVMAATAGVRRFGSASLDLAYVAAGRFDGFFETDLLPWDIATGLLLVREAGGFVSEIGGGHNMIASGSVLAANAHFHLSLGKTLRGPPSKGGARPKPKG